MDLNTLLADAIKENYTDNSAVLRLQANIAYVLSIIPKNIDIQQISELLSFNCWLTDAVEKGYLSILKEQNRL